jgi:hypothetical protein
MYLKNSLDRSGLSDEAIMRLSAPQLGQTRGNSADGVEWRARETQRRRINPQSARRR